MINITGASANAQNNTKISTERKEYSRERMTYSAPMSCNISPVKFFFKTKVLSLAVKIKILPITVNKITAL
jgi:hypothetical protein